MRLLNTESLRFAEFYKDVPPYAILSHTWGQEEVTITQVRNGTATQCLGWRKIQYACRQARRDGLQFAWIDTCCIDKSSSVELSEAVNSMYEWFAQAAVCYVYLEDVLASDDGTLREDSHELLSRSRWFTRSWTLQELIAPSRVIFYDALWNNIGSKSMPLLLDLISRVTGIPSTCLSGKIAPSEFSVATRMSWASRRTSTRVEDLAYSLMGLFGVNMPLLYGEGSKAFIRLQEEILKRIDDQSILAWTVPENDPRNGHTGPVLAESPADFRDQVDALSIYAERWVPSYITNKGLSISLPLARVPVISYPPLSRYFLGEELIEVFEAYLNCGIGPESLAKIYLVPVIRSGQKSSTHVYNRLATSEQLYGSPGNAKTEAIYIQNRRQATFHRPGLVEMPIQLSAIAAHSPKKYPKPLPSDTDAPHAHRNTIGDDLLLDSMFLQALQDQIFRCRVENVSGEYFIPNGALEKVFDGNTIHQIMTTFDLPASTTQKLVSGPDSCQKIFAILLLSDLLKYFVPMIELSIEDSFLPMPKEVIARDHHRLQLDNSGTHWTRWNSVARLISREISLQVFFQTQWHVLAPTFQGKEKVPHFVFAPYHIMPFLPSESTKPDSWNEQVRYGSFSAVQQVNIHPNHFDFGAYGVSVFLMIRGSAHTYRFSQVNNPKNLFAIKHLREFDREQFRSETKALVKFRRSQPLHIIQLLATFLVQDKLSEDSQGTYHLIFPWAEGNLAIFWTAEQRHSGDEKIIPWLSKQCYELGAALAGLHAGFDETKEPVPLESDHFYGRHGDIKPSNILWFPAPQAEDTVDLGQLVFGDFGLASFHRRNSRSNIPSTNIPRSLTYSAPEFEIKDAISRSIDIWSLGCIFLECVTWFLEGSEAVDSQFPELRLTRGRYGFLSDEFFQLVEEGDGKPVAIVKPQVMSWLERLHKNHSSSPYLHDFLDLVSLMLVVDPVQRISAADVSMRLDKMYRLCSEDRNYYRGGSRRPPSPIGINPLQEAALGEESSPRTRSNIRNNSTGEAAIEKGSSKRQLRTWRVSSGLRKLRISRDSDT